MMNVWITITRKKAHCRYCEKDITIKEPQVVCQYFWVLRNGKKWMKKMSFHPSCWVKQGVAAAREKAKEYVEKRGRKRSDLSDTHKEMREKILRRHSSFAHRLNVEMEKDGPNYEKVANICEKMELIKVEIEPYGGVPKSWIGEDESG